MDQKEEISGTFFEWLICSGGSEERSKGEGIRNLDGGVHKLAD